MKDRYFTWMIIPFFLMNQVSYFPSESKNNEFQMYDFEIGSEENEIIVKNDSKETTNFLVQKKKFMSIEQRLATILQQPELTSKKATSELGRILESMSGGCLYGEKVNDRSRRIGD